jgi:hypothetical protein
MAYCANGTRTRCLIDDQLAGRRTHLAMKINVSSDTLYLPNPSLIFE